MLVKKVKGKNEIRYVIVTNAEIAVAKKLGIPLKTYIKQGLMFIAIKRKWKWFFNKERA
jgi:uncharacterized protein with PhoU and TrkA domain